MTHFTAENLLLLEWDIKWTCTHAIGLKSLSHPMIKYQKLHPNFLQCLSPPNPRLSPGTSVALSKHALTLPWHGWRSTPRCGMDEKSVRKMQRNGTPPTRSLPMAKGYPPKVLLRLIEQPQQHMRTSQSTTTSQTDHSPAGRLTMGTL